MVQVKRWTKVQVVKVQVVQVTGGECHKWRRCKWCESAGGACAQVAAS